MEALAMLRFLRAIGVCGLLVAASPVAGWAVEDASTEDAGKKEWEPPLAQVPTMVVGEVISVDSEERSFTVLSQPMRRRPPGKVVVGVNTETKMSRNEMLPMEQLTVGDEVKVRASNPGPSGLPVYARGTVEALAPLTVAVSKAVRLIVDPGAEVQFVRVREMKLEDMYKGMEVQVLAWRGEEAIVAREVEVFEILPGVILEPKEAQESGEAAAAEPEQTTKPAGQ
jgi:hypothetical protein